METEKKVVAGNDANPVEAPDQGPKKSKKPLIISLLCVAIVALIAGGVLIYTSVSAKMPSAHSKKKKSALALCRRMFSCRALRLVVLMFRV